MSWAGPVGLDLSHPKSLSAQDFWGPESVREKSQLLHLTRTHLMGIAASYLVGQQIQSLVQNLRGFGEQKLPHRRCAAGVPGAITGQQRCQVLGFQRWQLHGGEAEWQQVSDWGEEATGVLSGHLWGCSGASPRHRPAHHQGSHKHLRSSGHCPGAAARLCCRSSKRTLMLTTLEHKNVERCQSSDCDWTIPPVHSSTNDRFCGKTWTKHSLIFNNWMIFSRRAKVWNHSPFVTVTLHLGEETIQRLAEYYHIITQQRELQAWNKSNIICNYLSAVYDTTYVRKGLY